MGSRYESSILHGCDIRDLASSVDNMLIRSDLSLFCENVSGCVQVMADMTIDDAAKEDYDLVVCPGGMPGK